MNEVFFVGPSGRFLPSSAFPRTATILPPVKRGDVDRVVSTEDCGRLVVVDGAFHQVPAVGHKELITAIEKGWQVVGLSSMGAIRAYELRDHGMIGYGRMKSLFSRFEDLTDDEFALLHSPASPYFTITEPLVNLRQIFVECGESLGLDDRTQQSIIRDLKRFWFGDRKIELIAEVLEKHNVPTSEGSTIVEKLRCEGAKELDLRDFLNDPRFHNGK